MKKRPHSHDAEQGERRGYPMSQLETVILLADLDLDREDEDEDEDEDWIG